MVVRDATEGDLDTIVDLHLANFDRNELSSILGRRFVRAFYAQAIADRDAIVKVVDRAGAIAGLSLIFFRYGAFEERFRKAARASFVGFALQRIVRADFGAVVRALRAALSRKNVRVEPPLFDAYLGSLALDAGVRKDMRVVTAFYRMIRDNAALLRDRSPAGFWASCRESNAASERALKILGMHEIALVSAYPEAVRIFASDRSGTIG